MLEECIEDIALAFARVCAMRAIDCAVFTSGGCTSEERRACDCREMWRQQREVELLGQLSAWQASVVTDWARRSAEWRRRSGAFGGVEDECWVTACDLTYADIVSSPFASFDGCERLFLLSGVCANVFSAREAAGMKEESARRQDTVALLSDMCPVTERGEKEARHFLVEFRQNWRVLFFLWLRLIIGQEAPPSCADSAMLVAASKWFLRKQRLEFLKVSKAVVHHLGSDS